VDHAIIQFVYLATPDIIYNLIQNPVTYVPINIQTARIAQQQPVVIV
jgi:hypothetical protein